MPRSRFRLAWMLAILLGVSATTAQEGHPLTGTWFGDWGPDLASRNHLTVVLDWDGDAIRGVINPGPGSVPISDVFLDVRDWSVRLEAQAEDADGNPVTIRAQGRLQDVLSRHRTLSGQWRQGDAEGDFRLTRD